MYADSCCIISFSCHQSQFKENMGQIQPRQLLESLLLVDKNNRGNISHNVSKLYLDLMPCLPTNSSRQPFSIEHFINKLNLENTNYLSANKNR